MKKAIKSKIQISATSEVIYRLLNKPDGEKLFVAISIRYS